MKRGGFGGAVLLGAAAILVALLALRHEPTARRAAPTSREEPAPSPDATTPVPPEPPPVVAAPEVPETPKPGARLVGRVTDGEGHPLANASLWVSKGGGAGEGEVVARTGEDGRYVYDGVYGDERLVGAIAAGHRPSELRRIHPSTQTVFELDFKLRKGGGTLRVAVGVEAADVFVEPLFLEAGDSGGRRHVEVSGTAMIEGLVPEWSFVRVRAKGFAPQALPVRLPPEGTTDLSVTLGPGATVFGTVHDADGAAVPGAHIEAAGWEWADLFVAADSDGAFRLEHVPADAVELRVEGAGGIARRLFRLSAGEAARWDPVLFPATSIEGRVVDATGRPVAEAMVTCRPVEWSNDRSPPMPQTTAADGAFRFADLVVNVRYRLAVFPPPRQPPPSAEVTTVPGVPPLTIVLPEAEGGFAGLITTRSGSPAAGAQIRTWPSGRPGYERRAQAGMDGSFRVEPLPAGRYFVEIHLDGETTIQRDGIEVRAGETLDLGVLRFVGGGHIRARVVDAHGTLLPSERVTIRSLDGTITYVVFKNADSSVSEELVPGRYLVSGRLPGIIEEIEVVAGEAREIDLRLRGSATLEAAALNEDSSRAMARFRVRDEKGRPVFEDTWTESIRVELASGTYTVDANDTLGRGANGSVRIPADGGEVQLVLTLEMGLSRR